MQENKVKIDKEILLKYLTSSNSSEDGSIIQQWLDNIDTEHELCEESLKFWEGINPDQNFQGYSGDHLLDRVHHNIKLEEGIFLSKNKPKAGFTKYLIRIAATLTMPLVIASLLFYFQNRSFREAVSWAEIQAPYGTRTDFHLPDGSTGRLNGGSSLKFPFQFTGKVREVELSGEAYFNVISDQRKSFIVSTGDIRIKVTGTTFNVMAYADEQITEVTLENGGIEVFKKGDGIMRTMGVLKPNESFIYNSRSDSSKIESVNCVERLSWLEGKLLFKYEPFEKVIKKINRWYNVNIIVKDRSLDSYIYYGTFQNETLDEVLKLLQYTAPIRFKDIERKRLQDSTFEKRKIEIYSRN